ncbi:MAG: hypothetical protein Q9200_006674, partial [Gallowayella weberi]
MGCVEKPFLNEIDQIILNKLSPNKYSSSVRRLKRTLPRTVLMFSDQQAVTGIALLSSAYAQLNAVPPISSYHWQIVVYLAWFSSLTHLTTLTVLRQYFRDNHTARLWRALLMLVTVAMLGAALLPTGDDRWFTGDAPYYHRGLAAPALCYFQRLISADPSNRFQFGASSGASMVISICVLASAYLSRILKLSERATDISTLWLKAKPSHFLKSIRSRALQHLEERAPKSAMIYWSTMYISSESLYVWLKAFSDVYESMFWE